ncbi:hypothetical protein RB195_010627 [Necator americanus]|uniref:Uncharacterized protein n=1 Tax=Necator americanus TaxID=51031 RepID=A0ABR1D034_NECAM
MDQLRAQLDTAQGPRQRHSRSLRTSWMTMVRERNEWKRCWARTSSEDGPSNPGLAEHSDWFYYMGKTSTYLYCMNIIEIQTDCICKRRKECGSVSFLHGRMQLSICSPPFLTVLLATSLLLITAGKKLSSSTSGSGRRHIRKAEAQFEWIKKRLFGTTKSATIHPGLPKGRMIDPPIRITAPINLLATTPKALPKTRNPETKVLITSVPANSISLTEEGTTTADLLGVLVNRRNRTHVKNVPVKKSGIGFTIGILAAVVFLICIVVVATIGLAIVRKKNRKKKESKKVVLAKRPRKMESANINATKFTHAGALVLDKKLRGPVVHQCSSQENVVLHSIQFDPHLNEIVDIGTKIEIVNDNDTTTTTMTTATAVGAAVAKKTMMTLKRFKGKRKVRLSSDEFDTQFAHLH